MKTQSKDLLRSLPSVSAMLEHEEVREWLHGLPRNTVVAAVQAAIHATREAILAGQLQEPVDLHDVLVRAEVELLERSTPSR
jgi:Selenocysteine synthase N terminal